MVRYLLVAATIAFPGWQLPPSVAAQDARMAEIAADTARAGELTAVPLETEGPRAIGAIYDQFLTGVAIGRTLLAAGKTVDAAAITAHPAWQSRLTTVVALPATCEGAPNHPLAIRAHLSGLPVAPSIVGEPLRGAAAADRLPGVALADDALVVSFRNLPLLNASIEIDYENPVCHGAAKTATTRTSMSPSRALATAFAGVKLPPDLAGTIASPTTVRVSVILDPAGRARFPQQLQGPPELGAVAIALLNERTFEPARVNGVPMPLGMLVPFVFTTTGARAPAEPYVPSNAPTISGSTMTTSTTVRVPTAPPRDQPSADVPGLSAATSKCAIAEDGEYGFTMEHAIKTGGGAMLGPAREQKYLAALRGPNGEGLRAVRRGSTLAPDRTILDLYEITYAGLAQPLRIYLDEYHDEPLKAPKGLVCATILDIK